MVSPTLTVLFNAIFLRHSPIGQLSNDKTVLKMGCSRNPLETNERDEKLGKFYPEKER